MLLLLPGQRLSENTHTCIHSFRTLSEHLLCIREHNQVLQVQCGWEPRHLPSFFFSSICLYWEQPCAWHCAGALATVGSQSRCGHCLHGTCHLVRKTTLNVWFSTCVKWSSRVYVIPWPCKIGELARQFRGHWMLFWREGREGRSISRSRSSPFNVKDQWSAMNETAGTARNQTILLTIWSLS